MTGPVRPGAPSADVRPAATAERVVGALLLAGFVLLVVVLGMFSALAITLDAGGSCASDGQCGSTRPLLMAGGVGVVLLGTLIVCVAAFQRRWRSGRTVWWVPATGAAVLLAAAALVLAGNG